MQTLYCGKCGKRLPPDALFCGQCGTRVDPWGQEGQTVISSASVIPQGSKTGPSSPPAKDSMDGAMVA